MMSKTESFLDWEISLRKREVASEVSSQDSDHEVKEKFKKNSLGISDKNFKDFMKEWKSSNKIS